MVLLKSVKRRPLGGIMNLSISTLAILLLVIGALFLFVILPFRDLFGGDVKKQGVLGASGIALMAFGVLIVQQQ